MKRKIIIASLVVSLCMGLGVTAYAATDTAPSRPTTIVRKTAGFARATGKRGYDFMVGVLNKFGVTEREIEEARAEGKTMVDLVEEKGVTQEEFREAIVEQKVKAIDEAVENGNITKEDGDEMKEILKENAENCTGNFGQRKAGFTGKGGGRRGNGQGMRYNQSENINNAQVQ